jgi:hypothetical protein
MCVERLKITARTSVFRLRYEFVTSRIEGTNGNHSVNIFGRNACSVPALCGTMQFATCEAS